MMEKKILTMASFNKFDWEIFPLSIVFFTAKAAIRKVEVAKQSTVMWFPEYSFEFAEKYRTLPAGSLERLASISLPEPKHKR